jgi:hypothetical protein
MPCSKFVCATASSSRSSESSSNSVKIAGTYPLSSWQRRCLRDKRAARNVRKQPYSTHLLLGSPTWTEAAVLPPGPALGNEPPCSSEACPCPPGRMSHARRCHRRWKTRRCPLTGASMRGLRES